MRKLTKKEKDLLVWLGERRACYSAINLVKEKGVEFALDSLGKCHLIVLEVVW